ncbi:MAG: Gfo/Idh/MocA family protein [Bilifractor sp.]|jgi:myo-inositol 2-dehydrogenase/D-chiro-inositol 1-dehydrogenase
MLRVGVIGCGGMGKDHIKRLTQKTQGAEVVAVCDVFEESAKAAAAICGAKVYTDEKQLINDPDVDAVFVVTPGFAHKDALLEAIRAGKRIFCEKPLCKTAEECLEVVKAEVESGKHLIQLGFMRRYDKGYQQVKECLKSGEYGEPLVLHCTHRNPSVPDSYDTRMAVDDTAIHEIDVLHWLTDDDYVSAQVIMPRVTKYAHKGLQDPQIMLLRTKKGIVIEVEVFVACNFGYDINCEVVCEDGVVKMPMPAYPYIRKNASYSTTIDTDCFVRFKDAYDQEVQDWVDAADKGVINGPNAWDGYLAAITADALVKAQTSGAIEKIEASVEKPAFYNS